MCSPPIKNGQILVRGGAIEDIGTNLSVKYHAEKVRHFEDCILMPGFVNAHTHSDYTTLRGMLDGLPYDKWLAELRDFALSRPTEEIQRSGQIGVSEMVRSGITCVADSGPFGYSAKAVGDYGLRGILYLETFGGYSDSDCDLRISELNDRIKSLQASKSRLLKIGISPHSVQTSSSKLIQRAYRLAVEENLPFMIHLSETGSSSEQCPNQSQTEYLAGLGVLSKRTMLAHCTHCVSDDFDIIARSGASMVHCPRSNSIMGCGIAPLDLVLATSPVGLGTDSAASNFDLSIFNEAAYCLALHRANAGDPSILSPERVLYLATRGGAQAIGLCDVGCIAPKWRSDFIIVKLQDAHNRIANDPYAALLFSGSTEILLSAADGRVLYEHGRFTAVSQEV